MNYKKIIQEFMITNTAGWAEEDFPAMEQALLAKRENILADLSGAIRQVCCQASAQQIQGLKGPAAIICISFLRTNIMDNIWQYRVDLYDDKLFLDATECCANYNMEFVWQYLKKRLASLAVAANCGLYRNKISSFDLEKAQLKMAEEYHIAATVFTKVAIADAIQIPEYIALGKTEDMKIVMGDYLDGMMLLHEEPHDSHAD